MVKKLTRTGNSVALVLDKKILKATALDAASTAEVSTDGRVIIVSPRPRRSARDWFAIAAGAWASVHAIRAPMTVCTTSY